MGVEMAPIWGVFSGVFFLDLFGSFLRSLFEPGLWLFWLHFGGQFRLFVKGVEARGTTSRQKAQHAKTTKTKQTKKTMGFHAF